MRFYSIFIGISIILTMQASELDAQSSGYFPIGVWCTDFEPEGNPLAVTTHERDLIRDLGITYLIACPGDYFDTRASEYSLTMIREAYLIENKKTDHRSYIGMVASSGRRSMAKRFAMRNLVSAFQRDGKIDEAVTLAEEILTTDPTDEESKDILFQLGMINMFSIENSTKAIEYFSRIVTDFPDDDIAVVAADHIELLSGGGLGKGAFGDKSAVENKPSKYFLSDNYPNPFNPETKINFVLPEDGLTKLLIYDLRGREVARLIDKNLNAGDHTVIWNASRFASGIYFYTLQSGNFVQTKKMMLLK